MNRLIALTFGYLLLTAGMSTAQPKPLGMRDAATFWSSEMPRFAMRDGKPSPFPRDQWRVIPMQDLFDALLYLGPASTITTASLPAALCADAAYRQMRRDRMLLANQKAQADQFDRDCSGKPSAK
jgi:hypothetical protein